MLSNKNDYDNFEHLKLSIEKPRGQLLCYIQYVGLYVGFIVDWSERPLP